MRRSLVAASLGLMLSSQSPFAGAGVLDPVPEAPPFCLLTESFVPHSRSKFLASLPDGGFVLGYRKPSSPRMHGMIFGESGQPIGPELTLDEPFVGEQNRLDSLASTASGSWIAVWTGHGSPGTDDSLTSVKARLYDQMGVPIGDSFQVNTFELDVQAYGSAAFLSDGNVLIAFESDATELFVQDIRARMFSPGGQPLGNDFRVTAGFEGLHPRVVPLSDAGFVILHRAFTEEGESLGIAAHHYDAAGVLISRGFFDVEESPFEVIQGLRAEADPANDTIHLAVEISQNPPGVDRLLTRLINLKRIGPRFRKTSTFDVTSGGKSSVHGRPSLLIGEDGLATLVWDANPTGVGDAGDVTAWRFSADNEPVSVAVQVDEGLPFQGPGAVLVQSNRAIVAWRPTKDPCDMHGRFVRLPETVFMDGFEGGSTKAWDQTVGLGVSDAGRRPLEP